MSHRSSRSPARRRPLGIEALEERYVPASILYSGGNLTISTPVHYNPAGQGVLSVIQDPTTGYFTVMDGTSAGGKYKVTGNITITGSNRDDQINVFLDNTNGKGSLPGSLTINGLNGNDTINVDGTLNDGSERIGGNLFVDGGFGNDQINVGTGSGLSVRGNSNTIIGNLGNDVFNLGGGAATTVIGGGLSVYSTQSVNLSKSNILGSQFITLQTSPTNQAQKFAPLSVTESGVNTSLALNAAPVTIVGGNLGDNLTFDATTTVGSTNITEGAGNDTLTLDATVNGNFSYAAGNGDNVVNIGSTANIQQSSPTVLGNLTITEGLGSNTYNIDTGFHVANNLTLNDNSSNFLNLVIGARIGGSLLVKTGTGGSDVTLDGGPLGNTTTTIGGQFFYTPTGSALNTINIDDDGSQSVITNIQIPTTPGAAYNLAVIYLGPNSPFAQTVNLNGGVGAPNPSNTTVNITTNGDTVNVVNNLLGNSSVT